MAEFMRAAEWFLVGFTVGLLFVPVVKGLTKIWQEAKIAKREWHNPPRGDNR